MEYKLLKKNKKAQLGLDVVEGVVLKILLIAILVFALILTLFSISTGGIFEPTVLTGTLSNETINLTSTANISANSPASTTALTTVVISQDVLVWNQTNLVPAANYTVSGRYIIGIAGDDFENLNVNVSGTYTYEVNSTEQNQTLNIRRNTSNATSGFFSNSSSIFDILAVVVIILAVVILIVSIRRAKGSQGV